MHGMDATRESRAVVEATMPRVLAIPGLDGDAGLLATAAPRLFSDMRTLVFDHWSDSMAGGMDGLADRALAVLDRDTQGAAPAFICGESFGGTVALILARRHPERVRGLILLSAFGWYPRLVTYGGHVGMVAWRLLGDRVAHHVFRIWRPFSVPGALGRTCPADIRQAYIGRPAPYLPSYRIKCALSLTFDARPWLPEIRCPAFVLVGSRDPVVPTAAGRELARLLPNAVLHQLAGGHLVHIVAADAVGRLIRAWITRIESGADSASDLELPAATG
jgi:pimeloyl-ACP methyl ester carboxylesterase